MINDGGTLFVYDPRSGERRELQERRGVGSDPNSRDGRWDYYWVTSDTADLWLIELPDDPQ